MSAFKLNEPPDPTFLVWSVEIRSLWSWACSLKSSASLILVQLKSIFFGTLTSRILGTSSWFLSWVSLIVYLSKVIWACADCILDQAKLKVYHGAHSRTGLPTVDSLIEICDLYQYHHDISVKLFTLLWRVARFVMILVKLYVFSGLSCICTPHMPLCLL